MVIRKYSSIMFVIITVGLIVSLYLLMKITKKSSNTQMNVDIKPLNISLKEETSRRSKWPRNTLVVVPAIWKEINWYNRSGWPNWLRDGLGLSNLTSRSYYVYLYQRVDPNRTYPYDYPYSKNVHEETGIYLQFLIDHYDDLPDKMLFMHGNPYVHTSYNPIESAQCIHDDVHFASVNDQREFIKTRPWTYWPRDPDDNIAIMYKCAKRILTILGFDADMQLNPSKKNPMDENSISAYCCAQFYVTKQRIQRYTYEQWLTLFNARLDPYCTTARENEKLGHGIQWFGGTFEHTWHVILGLYPTDSPHPIAKTNTDRCLWFKRNCKGSPCQS